MTPAQYDWMLNGTGKPVLDWLLLIIIFVNCSLFTWLGIERHPQFSQALKRIKAAAYGILLINYSYIMYESHDIIISIPTWLGLIGIMICDLFSTYHRLLTRKRNG